MTTGDADDNQSAKGQVNGLIFLPPPSAPIKTALWLQKFKMNGFFYFISEKKIFALFHSVLKIKKNEDTLFLLLVRQRLPTSILREK